MERTTPTYNTQSKLEKRYDQHAAWFGDVCQNIISCDPSDSSSHQNQEKLTREILDSQQTKKIRRSLRSDVDRLKYANTLAIHIASAEDAPAEDPDLALQDSVVKAFLLQEHLSAVTGDDSLLSKVAKTNLDSLRGDESLRAAPNFDQVEQALEVMCQIHEASSDANNPEPQQANIVNNVVNLVEDNQESALAPRIKPVVLTSVVALALTAGASPAAAQEMRSDSTGNTSPASVDAAFSLDRTATVFVLGDETGDDVATTSQVPKTKLDHVESPAAKQDKPKDNPATSENHTKSPEPAELNTDEPDIQAPVTRLEQAEPAQPAEESEAAESADSLQQPAAEDTEAPKKTSPTTFFIDANPTPAPEVAAAAPAPSPAAEPAKPEPAAEPAPTPETTPSPEVEPEEVEVKPAPKAEKTEAKKEQKADKPEKAEAKPEKVNEDVEVEATPNVVGFTNAVEGAKPLVYYNQYDEAWRNYPYRLPESNDPSQNLAACGCAPTSLAMASATLTDKNTSPESMGDYFVEKDGVYSIDDCMSYWIWDSNPEAFENDYGLKIEQIKNDDSAMKEVFDNGGIILMSQRKGLLAPGGHIMLMTGYVNGPNKDGGSHSYIMGDPASLENTTKAEGFTYQEVLQGLNTAWAVYPTE